MTSTILAELLESAAAEENAGRWNEALRTFDRAYRLAVRGGELPALVETVVRLGHAQRRAGDFKGATEHFELAILLSANMDGEVLAGRALNGLGLMAQAKGLMEEAEQYYHDALTRAGRAEDWALAGDVEQNLGIVANIRGDLDEAERRYTRGLELAERTSNRNSVVSALNNLGMLHVDRGRLDHAEVFFDKAAGVSLEIGNVLMQGAVEINRAELHLARDEPERARESCDQAFEIFSRLGNTHGQAEAFKFYGIIYRQGEKLHLAAMHLERAIELAASSNPLIEAESQRELALVFRAQGRNREALTALNRSHALFTRLRAETDQTDIRRRIARLEGDFLSLVQMWGESIEAKDRYTGGHCERVADYACRLGAELGIAPNDMVWFRMGAFLHDLGKTEVPEEVLNKPGRLTDEERSVMERHPAAGEEMLASVEFPWDIRPMVRSHHERWDGHGYPDGLVGEAIPFSARILRVADVFDALTTTRSYRHPLTPEAALALMEQDEGSFDGEIFAAFRRLFPELRVIAERAGAVGCD
ncbi:MAG TPA: HD domain-containing phosphohydrolase [Longimicrobium sp.]|nr:HD domain-containing phosphohydrolase [Longimicrobium sp.]